MGILRMDDVSGDADLAALLRALPSVFPVTKPAASPAEGTAAARRPLPVAARKCLRSMPALTRELFIFGDLRIKILTQWMGGQREIIPSGSRRQAMKSSTLSHRLLAVFVLSPTTSPLFITHFTLLSTTLTSASGSPPTATQSPRYPGATAPNSFSFPSSPAASPLPVSD